MQDSAKWGVLNINYGSWKWSPAGELFSCRGAASGPNARLLDCLDAREQCRPQKPLFLEVGVCCARRHGLAEHGLRRLPRTRVVLTLGMAFPDVSRCLPRVTRGRHLNASEKKAMQLVFLGKQTRNLCSSITTK